MISFISSFETINIAVGDPKNFLCILVSYADAAAINFNDIKTFLANC